MSVRGGYKKAVLNLQSGFFILAGLFPKFRGVANKNNRIALTVLAHIICWLVFLSLPGIFNSRHEGIGGLFSDLLEPPRWRNALLLIAVFYFNYYIAFRKLYVQRRYGLLLLSFAMSFGLFFLLNFWLMPGHLANSMPPPPHWPAPGNDGMHGPPPGGFHLLGNGFNLFMFIIVYAFSFALCLYEQLQKAKEEKLSAELSFLRAQINPHFLFNTLNSIYSLTLTKSDKAPDAIIKLSGMMRYFVSDTSQGYVSLSKELGYINDYIDLQKLRLSDKVKLRYEVAGDQDGKRIAPFLLIPFIENAFKYGVNSNEESDIFIKIHIHENDMHLHVYNAKVYIRPDIDKGTGLGINTTKQRLNLLYPGKHSLAVKDNEKDFAISLNITFK